jgi:hypothetical protein
VGRRRKSPGWRAWYFAHNELSRLCLDAFRNAAGEPISTDDIAGQIIAAKGFDLADGYLRAAIRDQVGSVLKRLHRRGIAEPTARGAVRAGGWFSESKSGARMPRL